MKFQKQIAVFLIAALLLCACGNEEPAETTGPAGADPVNVIETAELFTDRDLEGTYQRNEAISISLNGSSASCNSSAVTIDGSTVTITDEGVYVLSGALDDGMIVVNTDNANKVQLVLDGVSIHSETSAPIYVVQADKVFLTLAENSSNTLSNSGTYVAIDENNIDAVIFSKEDLTLNGTGNLTINSPGGHGIVSKDELTLTGGTYQITSTSHGLSGKDNVCIASGNFTITAGKDGIQAENDEDTALGFLYVRSGNFSITAEGDGLSAGAQLQVDGGIFNITAGGGSENGANQSSPGWGGGWGGSGGFEDEEEDSTSMKAIKSAQDMAINAGVFTVDCADDAIHADTNATITGGTYQIATGDDAFHAEENLTIEAGDITVTESYEGLEALHILVNGGDIDLVCSDDGLNAAGGVDQSGTGGRDEGFGGMGGAPRWGGGSGGNSDGSIVITGGDLYVNSSGDGIDANGYLEITGGHIIIVGPTTGDTATLDYDISATITGGTFIGTGSSMMAQSFSDVQNQGIVAIRVSSQDAHTQITLTDSEGNVVISHTPELNFAVIILSSPDIVKGESYTLTAGSITESFTAE